MSTVKAVTTAHFAYTESGRERSTPKPFLRWVLEPELAKGCRDTGS